MMKWEFARVLAALTIAVASSSATAMKVEVVRSGSAGALAATAGLVPEGAEAGRAARAWAVYTAKEPAGAPMRVLVSGRGNPMVLPGGDSPTAWMLSSYAPTAFTSALNAGQPFQFPVLGMGSTALSLDQLNSLVSSIGIYVSVDGGAIQGPYPVASFTGGTTLEGFLTGGGAASGSDLTGLRVSASELTVGAGGKIQLIPTPSTATIPVCSSYSGFLTVSQGIVTLGAVDESLIGSTGYLDQLTCGAFSVDVLIKPRAAVAGDSILRYGTSKVTGADGVTTLELSIEAQSGVKGQLAIGAYNNATGHWLLHNGRQWVDYYPNYSQAVYYNSSLSFATQSSFKAYVQYSSGSAMRGISIFAVLIRSDGRADDFGVLASFPQ